MLYKSLCVHLNPISKDYNSLYPSALSYSIFVPLSLPLSALVLIFSIPLSVSIPTSLHLCLCSSANPPAGTRYTRSHTHRTVLYWNPIYSSFTYHYLSISLTVSLSPMTHKISHSTHSINYLISLSLLQESCRTRRSTRYEPSVV